MQQWRHSAFEWSYLDRRNTGVKRQPGLLGNAGYLATLVVCVLACSGQVWAQAKEAVSARMLTISGMVDSSLKARVSREIRKAAQESIETIVFDIQLSGGEFATCYDLANEIAMAGGSIKRTIGFVSKDLSGHAVLVAFACDEIVMNDTARLGDLGAQPFVSNVTETMETAYREIATKKGRSAGLLSAMLHRDRKILEIETPNTKRIVPESELAEIAKQTRILKQDVLKDQGVPMVLDSSKAQKVGLIRTSANSRRDVALLYNLPDSITNQDELRDEALRPAALLLTGSIDARMYQFVLRRLQQAQTSNCNLLFVRIESSTGDVDEAINIATAIREFPGRKVAWVPDAAIGPSTFIVVSCDECMVGEKAKLGEFKPTGSKAETVLLTKAMERAADKGSIPIGMIRGLLDPASEVFLVQSARNPSVQTCVTGDQLEEPVIKASWVNPRRIKEKGIVWALDGQRAKLYHLATGIANNEDQLRQAYDLSEPLRQLEHNWVDHLVDALTSPVGSALLIIIGMTCLYLEFQMPGTLVGGIVAAICFTLFFWSQALSGTANSLEIALFILGVIFLAIELFLIPGFGITGITGIVLIFASLLLASQSFALPSTEAQMKEFAVKLSTLVASFVVGIGAIVALARCSPRCRSSAEWCWSHPVRKNSSKIRSHRFRKICSR